MGRNKLKEVSMACLSQGRKTGLARSRALLAVGLLAGFAATNAGVRAEDRSKGSFEMAANTSMSSSVQGSSSQVSATGTASNVVVPQMKSPLSLRPAGREPSGSVNPGQNVLRPAGNLSLSAAASQGGVEVKTMQPAGAAGPTGSQNATSIKHEQAQPLPK
jgi:hypothetical protein